MLQRPSSEKRFGLGREMREGKRRGRCGRSRRQRYHKRGWSWVQGAVSTVPRDYDPARRSLHYTRILLGLNPRTHP